MIAVREVERTATSSKGFDEAVKSTIREMQRSSKVVGWDVLSVCCESPHEGKLVYRANIRIKLLEDR